MVCALKGKAPLAPAVPTPQRCIVHEHAAPGLVPSLVTPITLWAFVPCLYDSQTSLTTTTNPSNSA